MTATLVARLVKLQRLHLEMSATNFFPAMPNQATLRHILSHSTGYRRTLWNQKIEAGIPRIILLQELAQGEKTAPGLTFDYHNLAFSLVEDAIANIEKTPFAEVMKTALLTPLGMTNTTIGNGDFAHMANFAWPHQKNDKQVIYPSKTYSCNYHKSVCASGGINSTVKDMAIFLSLQLGNFPDFLSTEDLSMFHAPQIETMDALKWLRINSKESIKSYYGLGWRSLDYGQEHIVFHGGWLKGFTNFLAFIPSQKIGIVVLNNSEGNFAQKVAFTFFDLIKE